MNLKKTNPPDYYVAVEEWLYPTESGREIAGDFDTYEEALRRAGRLCKDEMFNFADATGCDPSNPTEFVSPDGTQRGVMIADSKGLEEWWYAVKIVPVRHGLE